MNNVFGFTSQRAQLAQLINNNKLPHAILFSGRPGIGKKLVGNEIAKSLLCPNTQNGKQNGISCGLCNSCTTFHSGNHPDFRHINCEQEDTVSTKDIRILLSGIFRKGYLSSTRVTLISDAELLSVSALNILLKTLEEPPQDVFFILTCSNIANLPATIRSRCQSWYFDDLSRDEIKKILSQNHPEVIPDLSPEYVGSVSEVLALHNIHDDVVNLKKLLHDAINGRTEEIILFAQAVAKDRKKLPEIFLILRTLVREKLLSSTNHEEISRFGHTLANLLEGENLINNANINPALILAEVLLTLDPNCTKPYTLTLTNQMPLTHRIVI